MKETDNFTRLKYYFFTLDNVCNETWFILHTISLKGNEFLEDFLQLLRSKFVCSVCRKHINEYLNENKILTLKDTLIFHNVVNKRVGKPILIDFKIVEDLINDNLTEDKRKIVFDKKLKIEGFLYSALLSFIEEKLDLTMYILNIIDANIRDFPSDSFYQFFNFLCDYFFPCGNRIFNKDNSLNVYFELKNI